LRSPFGSIVSTVLAAKNGVITEERFQKMTWAQWFFHFLEVIETKKEAQTRETQMFEILLDRIEMAGLIAHPKTNRDSVVQNIEDRALKRKGVASLEDAMAFLEENKDLFPETIEVNPILPDKESKYFLPKQKREGKKKPGIVIGEK